MSKRYSSSLIFFGITLILPTLTIAFHHSFTTPIVSPGLGLKAYTNPYDPGPNSCTPNSAAFEMIRELSPYSTHALSPLKDPDFFLKEPVEILPWKTIEHKPHRSTGVYSVQTLPSYCPSSQLLRFRGRVPGRVDAPLFSSLLTTVAHRKKWDVTVSDVYKVADVGYSPPLPGTPEECGVGYCRTVKALGGLVTPREQLTLCGVQSGIGGSLIWAFELPSEYTDASEGLWPDGKRLQRASTDVFSAALVQRRGFFEVEYVLSLDVGGGGAEVGDHACHCAVRQEDVQGRC